jgi:hypothetical protein
MHIRPTQKAKASMTDSPVGLPDLSLPALGALGSVALNDARNWSCESLEWFVIYAVGVVRMEFRMGWVMPMLGALGRVALNHAHNWSCELRLWHSA